MYDVLFFFFFFKQKTAYEIPKRDWSSDVCSSDLSANDHFIETDDRRSSRTLSQPDAIEECFISFCDGGAHGEDVETSEREFGSEGFARLQKIHKANGRGGLKVDDAQFLRRSRPEIQVQAAAVIIPARRRG